MCRHSALDNQIDPPRGTRDSAELITSTDEEGKFRVEAQRGRYFLKITQGVTPVYGDEVSLESGKQVLIPLRKSAGEAFSPLCLEGSSDKRFMQNLRPEGIALLPSGMVILSGPPLSAKLWQVRPTGFAKVKELPNEQVIDVAVAGDDGRGAIFVLTNILGRGWLKAYSAEGVEKRAWPAPRMEPFSGFSVASTKTVYVALVQGQSDFQILKLDPMSSRNSGFEKVADLGAPKGGSIGPIAVDVARNRLFAADDEALYRLDLTTGRSHRIPFKSAFGNKPRSLALDTIGNILYVATKGHIWKVLPDSVPPEVKDFAPALRFRSPTALAIDENGKVWVSDEDAGAIYLLSPQSGQLVGSVR